MRPLHSCHGLNSRLQDLRPVAVALLLGILVAGPACAQEAPRAFLYTKPKSLLKQSENNIAIQVRPNTLHGQSYYLYVLNPAQDEKQIEVRLKAGDEVLERWRGTVPAGMEQLIQWQSGSPAPTPTKVSPTSTASAAPSPSANPWRPLGNAKPNPVIEVFVNGTEKPLSSFPILIRHPRQYVELQNPTYNISTNERDLSVELAANEKGGIPESDPCPVRLSLTRDRIPGLLEAVPAGRRTGALKPNGPRLIKLDAKKILLERNTREKGYATVSVDGVERVYLIAMSHDNIGAGENAAQVYTKPAMRWGSPKLFGRPDKNFKVRLEVDNEPAVFKELVVQFGRLNAKGDFEAEPDNTIKLPSTRDEQLEYSFGSDGSIRIRAKVKDWEIGWDATDRQGEFIIRARMLEGKEKEEGPPVEALGRNGLTKSAEATVVFDGTPPQGVQFKNLPVTITRGEVVSVHAVGNDPESDIRQVFFFFGAKDDKNAKKVEAQRGDTENTWTADLAFPAQVGRVELNVEFINGVGLSKVVSSKVRVIDGTSGAKGSGTKVIGKVVAFGANLPQAGVTVSLQDPKGMNKAQATTNKAGEFEFKDVPPGEYQVFAAKADGYPAKRTSEVFRLEAGKTYDVKTVELR